MAEIYLLKQLLAFERNGTLSGAAAELNISQPALSRSMRKLEEGFGVTLFERGASRIALNETGKVAAKYAARVLEAHREMLEQIAAFDRSLRSIVLGACTPLPVRLFMPILQERFGEMAITVELVSNERMTAGLRNHIYQIAIFYAADDDRERFLQNFDEEIFRQKYAEERLCVTFPENHPLSFQKEVSFRELDGLSILTNGGSGFWQDICRENLKSSVLIAQSEENAMGELIRASSIPAFNSDRMMELGYGVPGRVTLPVSDASAHVTYYLACLSADREKYASVFDAACSAMAKEFPSASP